MKPRNVMAQIGLYCLAISQIALIFIFVTRFPKYLGDATWSGHEKAHLIAQISTSVGLACVILFLLYRFYASAEKWLWRSLIILGVFMFGGYWLARYSAIPMAPGGPAILCLRYLVVVMCSALR